MTEPGRPSRSSREQFGARAALYARSLTHREGESLQLVAEYAAPGPYRWAVDVGTGTGFTAFAVAPVAERVVAADITPAMLGEARAISSERGLPNVGFALALAESLPFADGSLDLVTCRVAAHHFHDLPQAVAEWRRVLAPGGTLVLADTTAPEDEAAARWMDDFELRRDPSHVHDLSPSEWLALLEGAGFVTQEWALAAVPLEFDDWVRRSGTPPDEVERLRRDILHATPGVKDAFRVHQDAEGAVRFQWDCLVVRAVRPT
jgi:SAM-dependent methyltransferase